MKIWSNMHERVESYLHDRRVLGHALHIEGEQLQRFARFAEKQGHHGPMTVELALAWANATEPKSAIGPARRLEPLRPFAKYCALFEPDTEIPPSHLLGPAHRRVTPHIYSEQEILDLLDATQFLSPPCGLRPATLRCLLGLLYATGLRVCEALKLECGDVDLNQGLLTIHETKFRKSRYVPLHPSVQAALLDYVDLRDRLVRSAQDPAFFLFDDGRAVNYGKIRYAFGQIRSRFDWCHTPNGTAPRLYDLRHTFACRRLLCRRGGRPLGDTASGHLPWPSQGL
jgi:site-specific recombinase XerD